MHGADRWSDDDGSRGRVDGQTDSAVVLLFEQFCNLADEVVGVIGFS